MLHILSILAMSFAAYVTGAYIAFRSWIAIGKPYKFDDTWQIQPFCELVFGENDNDIEFKEAAGWSLAFWWFMLPVLGLTRGVKRINKTFEFLAIRAINSAVPKPKKETPQIDKYEQLALKEVNSLVPEDM